MSEEVKRNYYLNIHNRESISINGIIDILGFLDDSILLKSECGEICIEGKDLKIRELKRENGEILILGRIDGVYYRELNKGGTIFRKRKKWFTFHLKK